MSDYTKSTNFASKDSLASGNPLKIVKGTEIDTEFNNIATAIATKTDNTSANITGGSITGITDLAVADGGTGASTASDARTNLGAAKSGANSDITSLSGLTTALSAAQGGTGLTSVGTSGNVLTSNGSAWVSSTVPGIGVGQSWQDCYGTRAINTVYQNTTGLPIQVSIVIYCTKSQLATLYAGTSSTPTIKIAQCFPTLSGTETVGVYQQLTAIIPNNHYYQVTSSGASVKEWAELR